MFSGQKRSEVSQRRRLRKALSKLRLEFVPTDVRFVGHDHSITLRGYWNQECNIVLMMLQIDTSIRSNWPECAVQIATIAYRLGAGTIYSLLDQVLEHFYISYPHLRVRRLARQIKVIDRGELVTVILAARNETNSSFLRS